MAIPSLALRAACCNPRICDVIRVSIASPAASSLAELILLPVDKRSMVRSIARSFVFIELAVTVAAVFVLITVMFLSSKNSFSFVY
jgi:hypothetical protein